MNKRNLKFIVLSNSDSIITRSLIQESLKLKIDIEKIILIKQNLNYYKKLFFFVSKRVGIIQTIIFSITKVISEMIYKLFFFEQEELLELIIKNKIKYKTFNAGKDLQKKVSDYIDTCDSKIILIGQTGILGGDFALHRSDRLFLNCHPGKLPKYRGIDSFKWSILKKDFKGCATTIHIVRDKIDSGEILKIDPYNWKKINWFFADIELLMKSGKNLAKFASEISNRKLIDDILKLGKPQKKIYSLKFKMNIFKELKTLFIYNKFK